jgi:hypothetical protein
LLLYRPLACAERLVRTFVSVKPAVQCSPASSWASRDTDQAGETIGAINDPLFDKERPESPTDVHRRRRALPSAVGGE